MTCRVTRLMEYTYESAEAALADMQRWAVPANGGKEFGRRDRVRTVRSAVIGPVFGEDAEIIHTALATGFGEDLESR